MWIYGLVDPETDDIRYVGKSVDPYKRLADHWSAAKNSSNHRHVYNWMRTLDKEPWIWLLEPVDEDTWVEAEQYWIGALREDGEPLTNLTDGGEGPSGWEHTKETKEQLSRAGRGRPMSEENRLRMSEDYRGEGNPFWGKAHTKETRQQISKALMGKPLPEETCRKMSEARVGELNPFWGKKHSEESKRKMAEAHKGKNLSEETRQRMSRAKMGRSLSEETKKKMSEAQKGKVVSEEARRKISAGVKAYWQAKKACPDTGGKNGQGAS